MLFGGRKLTLKEQTRKWQRDLRKETRLLDRQIRKSQAHEKKIQREIKKYAKKGERSALTILAKDLVKGRRVRDRLYTAKAQLNSVSMQLQTQMAMSKVAGALEQSTSVMQAMSQIVQLPQVTEACRTMAQEMSRAGIIQEMTDDMFEMMEPDDMEDEVEEEDDVLSRFSPQPKEIPGAHHLDVAHLRGGWSTTTVVTKEGKVYDATWQGIRGPKEELAHLFVHDVAPGFRHRVVLSESRRKNENESNDENIYQR